MIEIVHLFKELSGQPILKDINLKINDGEIMVILGVSGAGKTVLLQHLIGLMVPDKGAVLIDSKDITKFSEDRLLDFRKGTGYLFQDGALYDFMDVFENVAFPLREHTELSEKEISEKVKNYLDLVGLPEAAAKLPSELSGGMRKRAALARSVILGSKILFCDEPTSGLDPILSKGIWDLIRDISRKIHCTTVITSHDLPNSLRIADRLALMSQGRFIFVGSAQDLKNSKDPIVQEFLS